MYKTKQMVPIAALFTIMACGTTGSTDLKDTDEAVDSTDTEESTLTNTEEASPCDNLVGEGFAEGQISMNWSLQDIDGNEVSLYDYCGQAIYIEDTTLW